MITHSTRVSNGGRARPSILAITARTSQSHEKFPRESTIMPTKRPQETRLNLTTGHHSSASFVSPDGLFLSTGQWERFVSFVSFVSFAISRDYPLLSRRRFRERLDQEVRGRDAFGQRLRFGIALHGYSEGGGGESFDVCLTTQEDSRDLFLSLRIILPSRRVG